MAISLAEARNVIAAVATNHAAAFAQDEDRLLIPLDQAVGCTAKNHVRSPISTPTFDSAAIDGYAVLSSQTSHASEQHPVFIRVMGSIRAGNSPVEVDERVFERTVPCVEVNVGAPFPVSRSTQEAFDGIVPVELAALVSEGGSGKVLRITRPPLTSWHKRIAGSDFQEGDVIIDQGVLIAPKHVMALASVGVRQVMVTRLARVGVVTVGSEITSTIINQQSMQYKIPDANGPYITSALREIGCDAAYLGALPDNLELVRTFVQEKAANDDFDVIITTGGVASGESGVVNAMAHKLSAATYFHSVAMWPAGNTLFATMPGSEGKAKEEVHGKGFYSSTDTMSLSTPFDTPPKTPAVTRFLVTPYLRTLTGMLEEREIMAKATTTPETARMMEATVGHTPNQLIFEGSNGFDIFRHAILQSHHHGVSVEVSKKRSPAKTSPFATSNCWIHVPRGHVGVRMGDIASIYPFCSPKS